MITFSYNAHDYAVAAVQEDTVYAKPINRDGSLSRKKAETFSREMVEKSIEGDPELIPEGVLPSMKDKLYDSTLDEIHNPPTVAPIE